MFTGMVEAVGEIALVEELAGGVARLRVRAPSIAAALATGDSVAVDGACVTSAGSDAESFSFEAIPVTRSRTLVGRYRPGDRVNLELALAADGRIQGHFVQGHVDGVGRTIELARSGRGAELAVELPGEVHDLTVARGSIALNGVSLTVAELRPRREIAVGLVPHTLERTNLGGLRAGDPVNVEGDILAKYVARAGGGP